jgi:hypothetical protein
MHLDAQNPHENKVLRDSDPSPVSHVDPPGFDGSGAEVLQTLPASNPRAALVLALADAVRDAALAGDIGAMQVASDALATLVGGQGGSPVVNLASRRGTR